MKVPEWMFMFINPVMRMLLRSPLHGILSDSIMLVTFTGRKSGRTYVTPVRYVRTDDAIRAYSNTDTQWWRNLRNGAQASLRIGGVEQPFTTHVIENEPETIRTALEHYFSVYPEDAVYHDVRMNRLGKPNASDLDRAARHAVVMEAKLAQSGAALDSASAAI